MVAERLNELTVDQAATPADRAAITFASFRIDLSGSRLLQGARAIPLRPKTWAVLLYLAERPGTLVTRDELLDAIWRMLP
jgi:DNA-binding response OmpR family regulator